MIIKEKTIKKNGMRFEYNFQVCLIVVALISYLILINIRFSSCCSDVDAAVKPQVGQKKRANAGKIEVEHKKIKGMIQEVTNKTGK